MGGFGFNFTWGKKPLSVTHDVEGNWFYKMLSSSTNLKKGISDSKKLDIAFENPAFLKVLALNCDLFSLGKVNEYLNNEKKEIDFLYGQKKNPNHLQSWTKFHWEYMMYRMVFGYSVLRTNSNVLNDRTTLYWLNPARIEYENKAFSRIVYSDSEFNKLQKKTVRYQHLDGSWENIMMSELTFIQDLSNTCNSNFLIGNSRLDSLYKIISNSESSLTAKGVNLDFAKKFVFSGKYNPEDVTGLPMSEDEKESVEHSVTSKKKVFAVKSQVSIERFVKDIANLKLDDSYLSDYFLIGSMYGIPRDVLDANIKGSTYENQEKSMGRHVEYSLKPAGTALTDVYESKFSYEDLRMEWTHLLFNQVFEKDKAERQKLQLENLKLAQDMGVNIKDLDKIVNEILTM